MPTYEIKCDSCDNIYDVFSSYRNRLNTPCPKCGSATIHSRITGGTRAINKDERIPEFSVALGKPTKNRAEYVEGLKRINANVDSIMEHPY